MGGDEPGRAAAWGRHGGDGELGPGWTTVNNDSSSNELSLRLAANVVPAGDHVSIVAKRQTVGTKQLTSGYLTAAGHASWPSFRALIRARWDGPFEWWPSAIDHPMTDTYRRVTNPGCPAESP